MSSEICSKNRPCSSTRRSQAHVHFTKNTASLSQFFLWPCQRKPHITILAKTAPRNNKHPSFQKLLYENRFVGLRALRKQKETTAGFSAWDIALPKRFQKQIHPILVLLHVDASLCNQRQESLEKSAGVYLTKCPGRVFQTSQKIRAVQCPRPCKVTDAIAGKPEIF